MSEPDTRTFNARYAGRCAKCGGRVNVGDQITWNRSQRGIVYHAPACSPSAEPAPTPEPTPGPDPIDKPAPDSTAMEQANYHFQRGKQAYRDGQPLESNPYAESSGPHAAWMNGWHFAQNWEPAPAEPASVDAPTEPEPVETIFDPTPAKPTPAGDPLARQLAEAVKPYLDDRLDAKVDQKALQDVADTARKADGELAAKIDEIARQLADRNDDEPRPVELTIKVGRPDGVDVDIDCAHANMPKLLYLIGKRRHAYLWGPPGAGKSHAASQAAHALGLGYGYISLNPQTPESRLLGFIDATGTYRETPFFRAYRDGGVFCIDELDNAHPALLNTLNGLLENGLAAFPCGMVERHADFVLVATGNTNGRGGNILYPERRALDSAFAERFVYVAWDYDKALERKLTLAVNPDAKPWLKWVGFARRFVERERLRVHVTPRASMRGAELLRDSGWSIGEIAESVVFKGVGEDVTAKILAACPLPMPDGEPAEPSGAATVEE